MAYTHSKYEVEVQKVRVTSVAASASFGGIALDVVDKIGGTWGPGFVPHFIKGVAVIPQTGQAASSNCAFDAEIVGGAAVGTPTRIFTINLPTTATGGTAVYYTPTYVIEMKPGMTMQVYPTIAMASEGTARVILYVEPRWEEPANVTSMAAAVGPTP